MAVARVRAVDHDITPGVSSDEGVGDGRPPIREKVLVAVAAALQANPIPVPPNAED